jgi:hypothetical protein
MVMKVLRASPAATTSLDPQALASSLPVATAWPSTASLHTYRPRIPTSAHFNGHPRPAWARRIRAKIDVAGLALWKAQRDFMTPAEAQMEEMKNLTILDFDSGSGTRCQVVSSLVRYRQMKLARPLTIVIGPRGTIPKGPPNGELLVVGEEARSLKRPSGANFIAGALPTRLLCTGSTRRKALSAGNAAKCLKAC